METMASVSFKGGIAQYVIRSGDSGLYHANLLKYEGDANGKPPDEITIIRGIRQWTGSYNEDFLTDRLGEIIVEALSNKSMNNDTDSRNSNHTL